MISLNNINLEYKSTVLFGSTALLLSFIVGLISGIRWNIVLLRSFILTVVFGVIGFGVSFILKKYVPEIYGIVSSLLSLPGGSREEERAAMPEQAAATDEAADIDTRDIGEMGTPPEAFEASATEFKEFDKEALSHYSTTPGGAGSINTKSGKLGKHILESEKLAKYEPKIMAQAVRTMMSKDRE
jgi:hypothetical protein